MNRLTVAIIVLLIVIIAAIFYQHIDKFLTTAPVKQTELSK